MQIVPLAPHFLCSTNFPSQMLGVIYAQPLCIATLKALQTYCTYFVANIGAQC